MHSGVLQQSTCPATDVGTLLQFTTSEVEAGVMGREEQVWWI